MFKIGTINNRELFYLKCKSSFTNQLSIKDWLVIVYVNNTIREELFEIAKNIIINGTCYVCCVGEQGELLHDIIDEEIVAIKLGLTNYNYVIPNDIMTTWDNELEECVWFGIYAANDDDIIISNILFLDLVETSSEQNILNIISHLQTNEEPSKSVS